MRSAAHTFAADETTRPRYSSTTSVRRGETTPMTTRVPLWFASERAAGLRT
ncbi:MAG: hypothetical protein QOH29_1284 [Actinomycetota bacterium]|nr:hypothetical protein [Actinomycetota bacterium]